ELIREGTRQLVATGVPRGEVRVELACDVRHRGQGEAITVELGGSLGRDPARQVEEAFDRAYVGLYGRRPPGVEPEVMTWRVRLFGPTPRTEVRAGTAAGPARKGRRPAWFAEAGRYLEAAVYDRYRLGPGDSFRGPAVVEERESTVVVGPGARATVDRVGNLVVEVG
ncbi:MAG TPA: hydantoinase/oxoprolinase family protein, partial [Actinomycetota bacterium]|nr:hydantoinase/oxoprolinase family protein [Actinomycetota bacterium]